MPYVTKDANGNITGAFAIFQSGFPVVEIDAADPAYLAFINPPPVVKVKTQDLIAQFTTTDITAIQTALGTNPQYLLMWYQFVAQSDAMDISQPRFKAGWAALVTILGQPRMTAIATALGVTIV